MQFVDQARIQRPGLIHENELLTMDGQLFGYERYDRDRDRLVLRLRKSDGPLLSVDDPGAFVAILGHGNAQRTGVADTSIAFRTLAGTGMTT